MDIFPRVVTAVITTMPLVTQADDGRHQIRYLAAAQQGVGQTHAGDLGCIGQQALLAYRDIEVRDAARFQAPTDMGSQQRIKENPR
jgi:hypothetical protein